MVNVAPPTMFLENHKKISMCTFSGRLRFGSVGALCQYNHGLADKLNQYIVHGLVDRLCQHLVHGLVDSGSIVQDDIQSFPLY